MRENPSPAGPARSRSSAPTEGSSVARKEGSPATAAASLWFSRAGAAGPFLPRGCEAQWPRTGAARTGVLGPHQVEVPPAGGRQLRVRRGRLVRVREGEADGG